MQAVNLHRLERGANTRFITWHSEPTDRHQWLTLLAVLAAGAALVMAVLGLPPVDLHGPLHKFGIMDPFCGGTRAARYAALGDLGNAWRYNPLSILIVYGAGLALLRAVVGLLSRRWVTFSIAWTPARRRWAFAIAATLLVALEIRQQMRADLLMAGTSIWR